MRLNVYMPEKARQIDWRRISLTLLGLFLFCIVYYSPPWSEAIDPVGKHFELTREGKAALGLFLLAATFTLSVGTCSLGPSEIKNRMLGRACLTASKTRFSVCGRQKASSATGTSINHGFFIFDISSYLNLFI